MAAFVDIKERDEELYRAYKRAIELPGITGNDAILAAINTPTSQFWVSPQYVYRVIQDRIHGRAHPRKSKNKSAKECMYDEIFRLFNELRQKVYFRGCSTWFIISFAVGKPAPRFYISFRRARAIIARKRKEKQNIRKQSKLNQNENSHRT